MWLYGSRLGQYVLNNIDQSNQRRPKNAFKPAPIWLLGVLYSLRPTNLDAFKPSSLVAAKSAATLAFVRSQYGPRMLEFRRTLVFKAAGSVPTLLQAALAWALQHGWALVSQSKFALGVVLGGARLDLQAFSFDGLVLEVRFSVDAAASISPPLALFAETLKHLQMSGMIETRPLSGDWSGTLFNDPEGNVVHVPFAWERVQSAGASPQGECYVWDSGTGEWVLCRFGTTSHGVLWCTTLCGDFRVVELALPQTVFHAGSNQILLVQANGREHFLQIPDLQLFSSLCSKWYLLAAKPAQDRAPLSSAVAFRKTFEMKRIQLSQERRLEVGRRHALNTDLIQEFLLDFSSRFWFTYRRDLPRIASTIVTTDAGWGCLLRCGQMMVAEAYARILMGRGWNAYHLAGGGISPDLYQSLLQLFEDRLVCTAPFGLHAMVMAAAGLGHPVGQWLSPTLLAHVCSQQSRATKPQHFLVVPVGDGMLDAKQLRRAVAQQPVVLMVPVRLGVDAFNPYYLGFLTGTLELPQTIGIIGGRPGKCFHIVGHQDREELLYLDPHLTRGPAPPPPEAMLAGEYHTRDVLSMSPADLDPSLLFGFLIRDARDLDAFIPALTRLNLLSPIFSFL